MKNTTRTFDAATLKKVNNTIDARLEEVRSDGSAAVKIVGTGNHKTGAARPIFNLPPVRSCGGNCAACVNNCYAIKDYVNYRVKAVSTNHCRNMAALQDNPEKAFADLDKQLAKLAAKGIKFFRVHASGDFGITIDGDALRYGRMWYELAEKHSEINFLAFTKCYDVADAVPFDKLPNFELVLSEWTDVLQAPADLKKRYRTSRAVNDLDDARDNEMICPGNCDTCGMCWNLSKAGHDVAFEIH